MKKEETKEDLVQRIKERKEQLESELQNITGGYQEKYHQRKRLKVCINLLDEFLSE